MLTRKSTDITYQYLIILPMLPQELPRPFNISRPQPSLQRTLHSSFRTRCRQSAHSADHEVLKDLVLGGSCLAPVVAEVGDVVRLGLGANASERTLEGRAGSDGRGRGRAALALRGAERRASWDAQLRAWESAHECTGAVTERHCEGVGVVLWQ